MKLTNYEVFRIYDALIELRDQKEFYIPVKVGYKILKNIKTLETTYQMIDKLRIGVYMEYGTMNEDGSIQIPQDKIEQANKELNDLSIMENDFTIEKITLQEIEHLSLPLDVLDKLYLIIDGE